jgi:diguanylate cyclase (GGDEF)-like protein
LSPEAVTNLVKDPVYPLSLTSGRFLPTSTVMSSRPSYVPVLGAVKDRGNAGTLLDLSRRIARLEVEPYERLDGIVARSESLLDLAEAHGAASIARRCRLVPADVASRTRDIRRAVEMVRPVMEEAEAADDRLVISRCHAHMAYSLWRIGARERSTEEATAATSLMDSSTPMHLRIDHLMIRALVACSFGSGPSNLELFDEPMALCDEIDEPILRVALLNNLAWFQHQNGRIDAARATVAAIERVTVSTGSSQSLNVVDTIATVLMADGELDRAEHLLRSAIDGPNPAVATEAQSTAGALLTLSMLQRKRGDLVMAETYLERCQSLATDGGLLELEALTLRERSAVDAERGEFKAAYEHLLECHVKWETMKETQAELQTATLRVLHGTELALERSRAFEELAHTDPLTGLWNRRYLDRLPALVEEATRSGRFLAVAIADIDHFKWVNDQLSHDVGDRVLAVCARLVREVVAGEGTVVRLGGEEFLIVFDDCDPRAARRIAGALCDSIRRHDWSAEGVWPITISVGVATSELADSTSTLLAAADAQLYRAKRAGRDRVASVGAAPATV